MAALTQLSSFDQDKVASSGRSPAAEWSE